jgi:outer membrane receptor protein involved in Fe transport
MKTSAKIVSLTLILTVWASAAWAQSSLIKGRVVDKHTNETLPGVNISVPGTYKGAVTNMDGAYEIRGLAPGDYDLKASIIGYTVQVRTGIHIVQDKTAQVDFALESTVLALGQSVEVIGQKPLFETDITASQQHISSEEIQQKVVESVNDLVGEQLGVVVQDNKIHIRGGRADESLYIIDGQSIKDPLSGYSNTLYVNAAAVKELKVITGGFDAEYGQAMSGVVDIETKEGEDHYTGGLSVKSDNWATQYLPSFNSDIVQLNVGGPEPLTDRFLPAIGIKFPGKLSFFVSGYGNVSDTYLPHANKLYPAKAAYQKLAPRQENDWHLMGKLSWEIKPGRKLSISHDRSLNINQGYFMSLATDIGGFPYAYSKMLDNYNTLTKEANLTALQWVHTLSSRTFYRVSFSRFFTSIHSSVQNKSWSDYQEELDLEPIIYIPDSEGNIRTQYGDGFYDTGDAEGWYDYFSDNWNIKGDLTTQPNDKHSIKSGFEARYTDMQVVDINAPWYGQSGLGRNHDYFRVYPNDGAVYLQDRITYDGMIVNIGLRYDYWFPGKFVDDAINDSNTVTITDAARAKYKDETFELFGMRGKSHLSPRLGISHPVTDNDVLYLHYGHFSQQPKGQYVYAKLRSTSEATYQLFGNPNLKPTTTVAYEIGIKHRFNANQTLEIKAYYKDMFDYPTSTTVRKYSPRYGNISFLMYVNMDYARSRGIEMRFRRRYSKFLSGNIDFTYALATGKSSTPNTNLLVVAGKVTEKPLGESRLSWDRPYRLSTDLYFDMPDNANIRWFGLRMPEKWGLTMRWEYESGKRYQRIIDVANNIYQKDEYGSLSKPWTRVDIKWYKEFELLKTKLALVIEAENVFNTKVPRIINPVTGRPYQPGDVIPVTWYDDPDDLPADNPARYDWPRRVMTGLEVRF